MISDALCSFCVGQKESLDYLFWKCKEVSRICERLLPWNVAKKLRSMEWEEWLSMNLKGDAHVGFDDGWPATFGIGMWWIWRWWIDGVFGRISISMDQ